LRLLFDENMPPSLAARLSDIFPDSASAAWLDLIGASDERIWLTAREGGFAIVTKDKDFIDRVLRYGTPPYVVKMNLGNCGVLALEQLLREHATLISRLPHDPWGRSIIVLPPA